MMIALGVLTQRFIWGIAAAGARDNLDKSKVENKNKNNHNKLNNKKQ